MKDTANINVDLALEFWSEPRMTELFGCTKKQLRRLTLDGGLPACRLERGLYIYRAKDVSNWVAAKESGRGSVVSDSEDGLSPR